MPSDIPTEQRPDNEHGGTASFHDDPWVPLERTDSSVVFSILGARIRIDGFPVVEHPFLEEHYPGHYAVADGPAELVLAARVDEARGNVVAPPAFPGEEVRIEIEREGEHRFRLRLLRLEAEFDLAAGRGDILFTDLRYVPFRTSLENLLRIAFAQLLLRRRAFLFHSAGIVHEGKVLLFFGPSGSGKSTVTSFSRSREALSDDMVALDLSGPEPMAGRVPFFGLYPPEKRARGSFPIAAIFRLRKAPPEGPDRIVPLPPSVAAAHLLGSLPFVNDLGVVSPETLDLTAEVARRVPVAELWFRKRGDFWGMVEEWVRSRPKG